MVLSSPFFLGQCQYLIENIHLQFDLDACWWVPTDAHLQERLEGAAGRAAAQFDSRSRGLSRSHRHFLWRASLMTRPFWQSWPVSSTQMMCSQPWTAWMTPSLVRFKLSECWNKWPAVCVDLRERFQRPSSQASGNHGAGQSARCACSSARPISKRD